MPDQLPIEKILPTLRTSFKTHQNVILVADPGAGKTTRVPIALLNETWLNDKKIVMLEPRRLAAQRAASYMAELLNERVGETVGYRIRGDNVVSEKTRIEVVTEGILTRMIQNDQSLAGVGLIIFDEFHERSIHADLGLAFAIDVQNHLRDDLKLLVMSATIDGIALSELFMDVEIVKSEGKMYPVETRYLRLSYNGKMEPLVVSTIQRSLANDSGDILVFLPGQAEIKRTESLLHESQISNNVEIHLLYGSTSSERQKSAVTPSKHGKRKVILSTNLAETSLTIDGVKVVIDSGLTRNSVFDPRRGMSGLATSLVSQASADQRRGRAGRQQPGICYRLWTELQQTQLQKYSSPEILNADLTSFALELSLWNDSNGKALKFLDQPPQSNLTQAKTLLARLTIVDLKGLLTEHGRFVSRLGIHPRLAHMVIRGIELGYGNLACDIAAFLEMGGTLFRSNDIEFSSRWKAFNNEKGNGNYSKEKIVQLSFRLRKTVGAEKGKNSKNNLGILLALAYPERVAKRRPTENGKYQLSGNTIGILPKDSPLSREEYLAVGDVDGAGNEVKIYLAEPLSEEDLLEAFADQIAEAEEVYWDEKKDGVSARKKTMFGSIVLSEQYVKADRQKTINLVIEKIRSVGLEILPWDTESTSIRMRSEWLRRENLVDEHWPILGDNELLSNLENWLAPFLQEVSRKEHLSKLDMRSIVRSLFSFPQLQKLDTLAPTHIIVPTGSKVLIDYASGEVPILSVRLQEMFGETKTPTIGGGKIKVLIHLLSPAHRPIAITQDLPGFWSNAYADVRKEMRGRYPKHIWPENPLDQLPTKKTKRQI